MSTQRSPRAPSLSLPKALDKALAAHALAGEQALPTEDMARHLGYASLNNGRALATLASLRYFGLLDSAGEDTVALSPKVTQYRDAPDEAARRALLQHWLHQPAVFASLLEQFPQELPSDAVLHQALIQRGFQPSAAQSCAAVLRQSVAFAGQPPSPQTEAVAPQTSSGTDSFTKLESLALPALPFAPPVPDLGQADCIPVRLSGGRRAWLVIPAVFHEADKARLKAQIDLLLTTEQEVASGQEA